MKVKNIVKKAAVVGTTAAMLGATILGATAYNLADYPANYIVDGEFDGTIVVGEKAATSDVLGAIDIAASLQADSVSSEVVEIPGQAGEVSLGDNAFRFESSNDMLEIREAMGNVFDSLTDAELPALRGGTITTDEGSTDYNQYLNFDDGTGSALQPIGVNFAEDKNDVQADFLIIDNDKSFFEWELTFTEGLESAINSNHKLEDLEDEVFNIFGTDFTFVNSNIDTSAKDVTLEFMAGDVSDTLREGETKTYTIDGVDYEVTAVFISDPSGTGATAEAKFAVNGELTDSLGDGSTDTLSNGLQIGVRDLLVNSREGVVEFFLGANKVEFTDTAYDTTATGQSTVKIGSETIDDVDVQIDLTVSGSDATINSIKYTLEANPDRGSVFYIAEGTGVREYMEEPEALLSPTFDIRYEGLKDVHTYPISLNPSGDDEYEVTVTNTQGKEFSWPLITSNNGVFKFGDDDDAFIMAEIAHNGSQDYTGTMAQIAANLSADNVAGAALTAHPDFHIYQDDYFLVSDTAKLEKANSYVLTYDRISTGDNTITFSDLAGGSYTIQYTDSAEMNVLGYSDKLRVGGNTYAVWILDDEDRDYPIAVDLNNDGDLTNGGKSTFTVKGGGIIDFASDIDDSGNVNIYDAVGHGVDIGGSSGDEFVNMTLTTKDSEFDTTGLGDEVVTWKVTWDTTDDEIDLALVGDVSEPSYLIGSDKYNDVTTESDDDLTHTITSFGAYVAVDDPSNTPASLDIAYPEGQVGAQVFVVAGAFERTEGAAGSVTRDVVNPLGVGIAVLDKDVTLGEDNMIIVGGPCANTVAFDFLGQPANCGEGFEAGKATIMAKEVSGNVAILVAGYESQETLGASYVLADYATYLADVEGSEVEVIASDLNNLQVMTPVEEVVVEEAEVVEETTE